MWYFINLLTFYHQGSKAWWWVLWEVYLTWLERSRRKKCWDRGAKQTDWGNKIHNLKLQKLLILQNKSNNNKKKHFDPFSETQFNHFIVFYHMNCREQVVSCCWNCFRLGCACWLLIIWLIVDCWLLLRYITIVVLCEAECVLSQMGPHDRSLLLQYFTFEIPKINWSRF
jgi:hypothetical protein